MRGASVLTMFTAVRGLVHTRRINSPDLMRGMSTRMSASKVSVALTQLPSIDISGSDMTLTEWVGDLLVIPLHSPAEMERETRKDKGGKESLTGEGETFGKRTAVGN